MQDVLQEQLAQTVFKALKEQGGHIYVCGDVTMAGDVLKAVQSIVRQQGRLSAEEAGAFLSKLRVSRVHLCHGDGGSREAGNKAQRSSSGISKNT